jgi:hypothetical protein
MPIFQNETSMFKGIGRPSQVYSKQLFVKVCFQSLTFFQIIRIQETAENSKKT